MAFNKKTFCSLVITFMCPAISHADILGNPTLIGEPGKLEIQIGGGKDELTLDSTKSTGRLQIGATSEYKSLPASTGTFKEDQVFIKIAYPLNTRTQLFADLGTGKDSGQKSSHQGIGVKFSPDDISEIKMGLILRVQQVKIDIDGPFALYSPYNQVSDGTTITSTGWGTPLNGSEQIKYTRFDAFFGASRNTGIIRPYGGLCLTRSSGTDTIAIDDMTTTLSYPVAGGVVTNSTRRVSFNARSDISSKKYFSGVLGLSINPQGSLGMTAEFQRGVQDSFMLSGNVRF